MVQAISKPKTPYTPTQRQRRLACLEAELAAIEEEYRRGLMTFAELSQAAWYRLLLKREFEG